MKNPWKNLPHFRPFVLIDDREIIEKFNKTASKRNEIQLQLYPEPFLGDVNKAKILLLNLNPGYDELDDDYVHANNRDYKALCLKNLLQKAKRGTPFFLLHPLTKIAPGHWWWKRVLKVLILKTSLKKVASKIACLELHGYHSISFKPVSLPSQKYTTSLVVGAINSNKLIVCLRGQNHWKKLVPQLNNYKNFYFVSSPMNPQLTKKNCKHFFEKIIYRLNS